PLTANTGSGSGTLGLNLVDDDSIADSAGNKLGGTGTGNGNFTGEVYTIDKTRPTAAVSYSPTGPVKSGTSLTITATFDEPMADSPVVRIGVSGANTVAATNMTKVDSTHYTGTHLVGAGDGTATVALSIGTDLAGNLVTSAPTSGATFTVDNTPPTVSIVGPSATPTRSGPVTYTVNYAGANTVTLVATGITLNTTGTASAFV